MNLDKTCLMSLMLGAALCGAPAAVAFSAAPPPPPGAQLGPGMAWCPRCGGCGRVPSGFLGWNDKRCPECKGSGQMMSKWGRAPEPKHHAAPAPKGGDRGMKGGPKGGDRGPQGGMKGGDRGPQGGGDRGMKGGDRGPQGGGKGGPRR